MRGLLARAVLVCGVLLGPAMGLAQAGRGDLPPAVLAAKTVAVVNDTRDAGITKGAAAALANWGQFTLIEDPTVADITLRFEKTRERQGQSSQTPQADGKTSYSYGVSMSSEIHMKAYLKEGDAPIYETKTDDSKAKAGVSCVNDFHTAYRAARQARP